MHFEIVLVCHLHMKAIHQNAYSTQYFI